MVHIKKKNKTLEEKEKSRSLLLLSWNSQFFTKDTLNYFTLVTKYVAILPGHVSFSHSPATHGTFTHSKYLGPSALDPALLQAWTGFQLWAFLLGFRAALTWPALTPWDLKFEPDFLCLTLHSVWCSPGLSTVLQTALVYSFFFLFFFFFLAEKYSASVDTTSLPIRLPMDTSLLPCLGYH